MSLSDKIQLITRKILADNRGWFLKVIDGKEENLPNYTGEIYFTNASPGQSKGGHYHLKASEWFTLINGICDLHLVDVETGEKIESILELDGSLNPQQRGSQITYYRRYSLQSALSLEVVDDDGNTASQNITKVKPTLSDKAFSSAIERMINGEVELYVKLKDSYTLTPQQEMECKEVLS